MTPEAEKTLLSKLASVLRDLNDHGTSDGEAMFMLGASADYICSIANADTWPALKNTLGNVGATSLLAEIDKEGPDAVAKGQIKQAYALQVIGLSVAASASDNTEIQVAVELLDNVIATALNKYRQNAPKRAPTLN